MELSISTVVIVVLSLSMLILGLVFVSKTMCGAINGIGSINDQMKSEMIDLFGTDDKLVIKEASNEIYAGVSYGVGFAIRNDGSEVNEFSYSVAVSDLGGCSFSQQEAMEFIVIGESGHAVISSGDDYIGLIRFDVPKNINSCELRYNIVVKNGEEDYDFGHFDVEISKKPFSKSFCG